LAFDGDSKTAWCEGANGLVGESITVQLKKSVPLVGIDIQGGFFKDDRTLINNGRVRTMTVTADSGWSDTVVFDFVPERQHRAPTVHVRNTPVSNVSDARELTFSIDEADAGQFSKDVCVSEIILRVAP